MSQLWSWTEYDIVRKGYPSAGEELVNDLDSRSVRQLQEKAHKLLVEYNVPFTEKELSLARKYGQSLKGALIFLVPNRAPVEVEELLRCVAKR